MKPFRWAFEMNEALKSIRGVTFESNVVAVGADGLLDVVGHPSKNRDPHQQVLVVTFDGCVDLVPFQEADHFFLKTIIPSRKATRDYLKQGGGDVGESISVCRRSIWATFR